jgi:hypothetical protein
MKDDESNLVIDNDVLYIVSQWDNRTFRIQWSEKRLSGDIQLRKIKKKLSKILNISADDMYFVYKGILIDENRQGKGKILW